MGRCILILGIPRSGTSAVAGALWHLGVDMGSGHLQQADANNPTGYFEDRRWQAANKAISGPNYGHRQPEEISNGQAERYQALVELYDAKHLWGMKDPRLCFTAQFIWPLLEEPYIVAVRRSPVASARSLCLHSELNYKKRYRMSIRQAEALRDLWSMALAVRLQEFEGSQMTVQYEDLVNNPTVTLRGLGQFVFRGLDLEPDYKAARAFIDPRLNHHA